MKKIITILMLVFIYQINGFAQYYHWSGKMFESDFYIKNPLTSVHGKISYKGIGNQMRLYEKLKKDDQNILVIQTLDLQKNSIIENDTIYNIDTTLSYDTFIPGKNTDAIICSNNSLRYPKLIIYNRVNKQNNIYHFDSIRFSEGCQVNDSIFCLYDIYNYHPADGFSGLNMALFNINQKKITEINRSRFRGIGLGYMNTNFVYCNDSNIYVATPMSGILYKYNLHLDKIDSVIIPINWSHPAANIAYEQYLDSTIYTEYDKMQALLSSGKQPTNNIYRSDFVRSYSDEIHKNYEYIEKLMPYNDSVIIISVNRPQYENTKRDILFYNMHSNKISSKNEWPCTVKKELNKFEDYFAINVILSSSYAPYFHNNKIYYGSFANPVLYANSVNSDLIAKSILKDGMSNGCRLRILEYNLN